MKKALSILLAVLMLASLCGPMAFADDVVVEEEANEAVAGEPVGEAVSGEDSFDAADAYVEEYEGEGSFDAAYAYTYKDIPANWVFVRWEKPLSCTETAILIARIPHPVTGVLGDPEPVEIMPLGHNWYVGPETDDDGWFPVYDVPATCEDDGLQHFERYCLGYHPVEVTFADGVQKIEVKCEEEEATLPEFVPMLEHLYVQDKKWTNDLNGDDDAIVVDPDCIHEGLGWYVCKRCGLPATPQFYVHDENNNLVKSPYKEDTDPNKYVWEAAYVIPSLEELLNDTNPPKLVHPVPDGTTYDERYHDWGEWTYKPAPTCTEGGARYRYCNICHKQEVEVLKELGHNWVETYKERVDCETYNSHQTCSRCGEEQVVKDLEYLKSNEPYLHHRFDLDWEYKTDADKPTCMTEGKMTRYCLDCKAEDYMVIDKLPHEYVTRTAVVPFDLDHDGVPENHYMHWDACVKCEPGKTLVPFNGAVANPDFWGDGIENGCVSVEGWVEYDEFDEIILFAHDWGEYSNWIPPKEGETLGHWYRSCKIMHAKDFPNDTNCLERDEFVGTLKDYEDMTGEHTWGAPTIEYNKPEEGKETWTWTCETCGEKDTEVFDHVHDWGEWKDVDVLPEGILQVRTCETCGATEDRVVPPLKEGLIYEIEKGKPVYKLYEDDVFQEDFTDLYEWNDGLFFVVNGYVPLDVNGANMAPDGTWYFLSQGKVADDYTGLALYNGEWFVVENGVVDFEYNGLYEYNGKLFVVAAGKNDQTLNGLWLNDESLKDGDGKWYWTANGMWIDDYTGIAVYGGEEFYVENGIMIPDYSGEAVYNGYTFIMENGKIVAQAA